MCLVLVFVCLFFFFWWLFLSVCFNWIYTQVSELLTKVETLGQTHSFDIPSPRILLEYLKIHNLNATFEFTEVHLPFRIIFLHWRTPQLRIFLFVILHHEILLYLRRFFSVHHKLKPFIWAFPRKHSFLSVRSLGFFFPIIFSLPKCPSLLFFFFFFFFP